MESPPASDARSELIRARARSDAVLQSQELAKLKDMVYRISQSDETVESYVANFTRFCRFMGMTPGELLEAVRCGSVRPESAANDWFRSLPHLAPGTRRTYLAAVKKFCDVNLPDMEFRWKRVEVGRKRTVEVDRPPTKEELMQMKQKPGAKGVIVMEMLTSSGMRVGTLAKLRLKHIDLDRYPDVGVIHVPAELNKGRIPYITFITPQAKESLKVYLFLRESRGEKLGPESPVISHDTRLGTPIGSKSVSKVWVRMVDRAGLGEKPRKHRLLRAHTPRKYFATALTSKGVSPSAREKMMGHLAGFSDPNLALDSAYYRPVEEELLTEYRKGIPALTISKEAQTESFAKQQILNFAQAFVKDLSPEVLKKMENILAKSKTVEDAIPELQRAMTPRMKTVRESEIDEWLAQGWEPVERLSGRRIVIRKSSVI
jgi:integrase